MCMEEQSCIPPVYLVKRSRRDKNADLRGFRLIWTQEATQGRTRSGSQVFP